MLIKQIIETYELLDDPNANGEVVKKYLHSIKPDSDIKVYSIKGKKGKTDFIKIYISGINGKRNDGNAPTMGLIGRLGGLGARPELTGYVSDGDGALVVLSAAAKLLEMQAKGDYLEGDVYIATHICPNAPTKPHKPVPMMNSPVDSADLAKEEVEESLDAILSVDSTRANRVINYNGFAITPTVKEGFILHVSEDVLDIVQTVTAKLPHTMALATADITPYENGLYHINSILQPSTMSKAPVIGVALTTQVMIAGCATGACNFTYNEEAARFLVEVAKYFGKGECKFYDELEYSELVKRYGSMEHLQTIGEA